MILFLDDKRDPKDFFKPLYKDIFKVFLSEKQEEILLRNKNNIFWAKTYKEAENFVQENGLPEMVFFDNDLGEYLEGYDFLKWICNQNLGFFEAYFQTANPVAKRNMEVYYKSYLKLLDNV